MLNGQNNGSLLALVPESKTSIASHLLVEQVQLFFIFVFLYLQKSLIATSTSTISVCNCDVSMSFLPLALCQLG